MKNLPKTKTIFVAVILFMISLTLAAANADELLPLLSHGGAVADAPENDKLELANIKPSKLNIASLLAGYARADDSNGNVSHFSFKLNTWSNSVTGRCSLFFLPDSNRLLVAKTGNQDCPITIIDWTKDEVIQIEASTVGSVVVSPDGKKFAVTSYDSAGTVVWDAETGKELYRPPNAECVAFSPDGKRLAIGGRDNVLVFDTVTGKELNKFPESTGHATSVVFSPDGKKLLVAKEKGLAAIWDSNTVKKVEQTQNENIFEALTNATKGDGEEARFEVPYLDSADFSPDGKRVVTRGSGGTVIWDLMSKKPLFGNGRSYTDFYVKFTPNENQILSKSEYNWTLWDTRDITSWQQLHTWKYTKSVEFSSDGKRIIITDDNFVRILDAKTRQELQKLEHPLQVKVLYAAFSPDGKMVVTQSDDKFARVWSLDAVEFATKKEQEAINNAEVDLDMYLRVAGFEGKEATVNNLLKYGTAALMRETNELIDKRSRADNFDKPDIEKQLKETQRKIEATQNEIKNKTFYQEYSYSPDNSSVKVNGYTASFPVRIGQGFIPFGDFKEFKSPFPDVTCNIVFNNPDDMTKLVANMTGRILPKWGSVSISGETDSIKKLVRDKDKYRIKVWFKNLQGAYNTEVYQGSFNPWDVRKTTYLVCFAEIIKVEIVEVQETK
jgi:WD40 repeat protein